MRDIIDLRIFFYVWPPDEPNVFYDLSNTKTEKKPNFYITIEGKSYLVLKQMLVTYSWIDIYYSSPLENLENKWFESEYLTQYYINRNMIKLNSNNDVYTNNYINYNHSNKDKRPNRCSNCLKCFFIILFLVGWIIIALIVAISYIKSN